MVAESTSLIAFEKALELVLSCAKRLPTEVVPLESLLGRSLASPALSSCDLPPFDNSAIDGYALTGSDIGAGIRERPFRLVGASRAGTTSSIVLSAGEVARVFTGAPLPVGTAGLAMQEVASNREDGIHFSEDIALGENIRQQGSELKSGEAIVAEGRVNPATIGALAAGGIREAEVYRHPRIGLLVSGDELVSAGNQLGPGQIFESNGAAVSAAVKALGLPAPQIRRCRDDLDAVVEALKELSHGSDVIITSGGVSVGEHDVLRPAFERLGVQQVFWGVAIKPGKPIYFGRTPRCTFFGLPGNPVSALTTFFLFAKPYLIAISGIDHRRRYRSATVTGDLEKKRGRAEFVPCRLDTLGAHPMVGRASHKASCLAGANGFIVLGADVATVKAGTPVDVLEWLWEPEA